MCGFAGIMGMSGLGQADRAALSGMETSIVHRGPDAGGQLFDEGGIAFVHRRLSIIDLSAAGAQPMDSASGRFTIAYNGEIYNFATIRDELQSLGEAPAWRGHSDTEVLLAAIAAWGIAPALQRIRGMFAFALWDRETRSLTLARDAFGEKPLYFGWQGKGSARRLLFGSDLAALRAHPAFEGEIDQRAIGELCRLLYVPEPLSIWRGIAKLAPGTFATIDQATGNARHAVYFDLAERAASAREQAFAGGPDEAVDMLGSVLDTAIGRQMVADVPLGALLSGGIDSTTVVALMQEQSPRPVKTFTIGFSEAGFDEAHHARKVADHLGTEHTELRVEASDALALIPRLPTIYTEPFADSSQIPTYLVSAMARQHVTVALSGDGGDEMFGGYNRHLFADRHWTKLARIPRPIRASAGHALRAIGPGGWDRALGQLVDVRLPGDKVHKIAGILSSVSVDDLYRRLVSVNTDAARLLVEPSSHRHDDRDGPASWSTAEAMMLRDALGYLPGDILTKVDRAAMAVSLETRVPFLDVDVVDFAWRLPIDMKIRNGRTKWPLRALLDRYLPSELVERPKAGFGIPLAEWLRGPLRDWAEAHLSRASLENNGLFRRDPVRALWREHLSGARNHEHRLWPVLMTQAWLEHERGAS